MLGASAAYRPTNRVERRFAARDEVNVDGRLCLGLHDWPCRVADLSENGAQIIGQINAPMLSIVTLQVAGRGAAHARIVWRRNGRIGIRFFYPWSMARPSAAFVPALAAE